MILEMKTFAFVCDVCRRHSDPVTACSTPSPREAPEGWEEILVGPCGATNYYRNDLFCPSCAEKHRGNPV
jgi:hypothetical protein